MDEDLLVVELLVLGHGDREGLVAESDQSRLLNSRFGGLCRIELRHFDVPGLGCPSVGGGGGARGRVLLLGLLLLRGVVRLAGFVGHFALFPAERLALDEVKHVCWDLGNIVDELAADAVRAVTVGGELLAELGLVILRHIGLDHHVRIPVREGALKIS